MRVKRLGSHHTAAIRDANFSRLKHLLVLLRPLAGFVPTSGLRKFIGGGWDTKYKGVLDITADNEAKRLRARKNSMVWYNAGR